MRQTGMGSRLLGAIVWASTSCIAASASAQEGWSEPTVTEEATDGTSAYTSTPRAFGAPPDGSIRIAPRWDTFVYTGSQDAGFASYTTDVWVNVFGADVDIGEAVFRLNVPLGYYALTGRGGGMSVRSDQAELGNVELEGYADIPIGPEHRLLIGGGLALPTSTDPYCASPGCNGRGAAVRLGSWVTSFRNAPAWAEQSFGIYPQIEYTLGVPWVLVRAVGSIPLLIPTNSDLGGGLVLHRGNVELMMQLDVSGAVRIVEAVDVGVSFLGWAQPSGAGVAGNPDLGQTAMTFFVQTDPALDFPITGGAEFILNLDNAWGPTGDDGKYWGLHLHVGGRFDL